MLTLEEVAPRAVERASRQATPVVGKSAAGTATPPAATAHTAKAPKPAAAKGRGKGKAAKPVPSPTALPLDLTALDASQCSELVRLLAARGFTGAGGAQ